MYANSSLVKLQLLSFRAANASLACALFVALHILLKAKMLRTLVSGCLLISQLVWVAAAMAAPKTVSLVYEVTRFGQPFATVTESYRQENGRYRIESVTKGVDAYALFGERKITSEGGVTSQGLKPSHFELHQSNNEKKSLFADFDWAANTLTMKIKGKPTTVPLEKGTQDLVSFAYQFMFAQPQGNALVLPVTTGKKLRTHNYKVAERNVSLELPAGKFKAMHLVKVSNDASDDQKELWLGAEAYSLPVRIVVVDENGVKTEQTLTSLHVE